ncbi:MAG TPA: hypothetical protein EYQ50_06105 [Verrucomicrobiales bacterium]|nr:hypothetical protein [Verrucomicrobiales bacterium]
MTSNRPLRGGKANTYEGGVRVPWIVRWPGRIKTASVCSTPVQSVDIYPTVLEIVGVKAREGVQLDGQSIVPLLKGEAMEHQSIFTHFPHHMDTLCAPSSSVRAGGWKLIRYHHPSENAASHAYELFDLRRAPSEAINLASYLPYVFTEQGVAMLSSVWRSPRAVAVNIAIMWLITEEGTRKARPTREIGFHARPKRGRL